MKHTRIFRQKLTHRALNYKFSFAHVNPAVTDRIIETASEEDKSKQFKNVCAFISISLADRLESTLSILGMSKRDFLEMAIIEALDVADEVMDEVDIDEFLRPEELEQKLISSDLTEGVA